MNQLKTKYIGYALATLLTVQVQATGEGLADQLTTLQLKSTKDLADGFILMGTAMDAMLGSILLLKNRVSNLESRNTVYYAPQNNLQAAACVAGLGMGGWYLWKMINRTPKETKDYAKNIAHVAAGSTLAYVGGLAVHDAVARSAQGPKECAQVVAPYAIGAATAGYLWNMKDERFTFGNKIGLSSANTRRFVSALTGYGMGLCAVAAISKLTK